MRPHAFDCVAKYRFTGNCTCGAAEPYRATGVVTERYDDHPPPNIPYRHPPPNIPYGAGPVVPSTTIHTGMPDNAPYKGPEAKVKLPDAESTTTSVPDVTERELALWDAVYVAETGAGSSGADRATAADKAIARRRARFGRR